MYKFKHVSVFCYKKFSPPSNVNDVLHSTGKNSALCVDDGKNRFCKLVTFCLILN